MPQQHMQHINIRPDWQHNVIVLFLYAKNPSPVNHEYYLVITPGGRVQRSFITPTQAKTGASKLKDDADRNSRPARMSAIEQVISTIDIVYINIVRLVPVGSPVFWIWINHTEPIPAVLEARESTFNQERHVVNAERVSPSIVNPEVSVGKAVAAVAATLRPTAVLGLPMARAMLLPGTVLTNLL
jgi:hypothetical protein